jgi:hypothetical protein
MEIEIEITKKGKLKAILDDRNPETAKAFYKNLPVEGPAQFWYDEIYFPILLEHDYENPSPTSDKGIYLTGPQVRPSAYFSETHNPPQT